MFSSTTPSSVCLVMYFIASTSLIVFPAPKISSNTILKESCTDARPPIQPLFKTKVAALPTLRVCVAMI